MRTILVFLVSILGVCSAPALAARQLSLNGHWEGVVVLATAEQEIDVVMDFEIRNGKTVGQLQFPLSSDGAHEVENLDIRNASVSFSVRDKKGVASDFAGVLSPGGESVQGTMTESGKSLPFTLRRAKAAAPAREVPTYKLAGDAIQLKAAFNEDAGKTRILLLLTLGSFSSKMALRAVQRYVLDQIADPDLRVYVVWMAPDLPEAAKILRQDAALVTDPRTTQFWSTDRSLVDALASVLAPYKPVARTCLLYGPGRTWTGMPPTPDQVRQSPQNGGKGGSETGLKLNGIELAADVQLFLTAKKGP